jgi:RsiW-degrading membrane proteinase PrsW (M82 family)
LIACLTLGACWSLAAAWRAEAGTANTAMRGVLGGLAAVGSASIGYGLMQLGGIDIRWERIAGGAWPAIGFAMIVGLVEEGAKLAGIVLAAPAREDGSRRSVLRTAAGVATVFAVVEAALALRGSSWPVAFTRAAFGPVAHGALVAPIAIALAKGMNGSRVRRALRLTVAVGIAAFLHAVGDWSVARPGWGQLGFAVALLAPTLWLYARTRGRGAPGLGWRWAAARLPAQPNDA